LLREDLHSARTGAWLVALSTIVYNYSGWDNVSTYAAEVDHPQRNYPRAIAVALVIVLLAYLLPVIAGISVTTSPTDWNTDAGWPVISRLIGGGWLGSLIAAAGLVSAWALFNAQLLYVSRLPFVLAEDGWLSRTFANVTHDGVPREAVILFCVLTGLLASLNFLGLVVLQCILYTGALTLEFLALLVVRFRGETSPGSFRVPGGWVGLAYVCITPFLVNIFVLRATLRDWRSFQGPLLLAALSVIAGVALFLLRRRRNAARFPGAPSAMPPDADLSGQA